MELRKHVIIISGFPTYIDSHILARSILISQLDYCNATSLKEFYGYSTRNSKLLGACRTSTVKVHERYSITALVALAVKQRSSSSLVSSLSRSSQQGCMLAYLHCLWYERIRLDVACTETVYGQRAIRISVPNTWNSLPLDIQLSCS